MAIPQVLALAPSQALSAAISALEALGDLSRPAGTGGDLALLMDASGRLLGVTQGGVAPGSGWASGWVGRDWVDTVAPDSRAKVGALLRDVAATGRSRRREINHPGQSGQTVLVAYHATGGGRQGLVLAMGKVLTDAQQLQQQLLSAQQEMVLSDWRERETAYSSSGGGASLIPKRRSFT